MAHSPLVQNLVQSLCCLPGVGPKSAQRMALHILERNREAGAQLALSITEAVERVGHCQRCRTLTEETLCSICRSKAREDALLCVVENPMDVMAIEQSGEYRGRYFVLLGHLSPLDGIGPDEIGIPILLDTISNSEVQEVILATSTTVEGEATAYYLAEHLAPLGVNVSRIAHGVPLGGELEYVDGGTIARAFAGRGNFS
ncbi:MAG: recombination mediator RecR [Gammaproteobacteria bacterium]|nr:recombination mediator RecR [Gammaproteobacteria bacterium]MBT8151020.1 recombination mediator RecR [Gammaproteobacteria bacterium]NND38821.1 recombination protein RecR [Pseudomonadales bacterium]NNM12163.1 recombination protein RecR [Pseudomonadales bacterium]RZV58886.1 MAG: recombination protein RecR [Pseudomonadales bacterium]